MTEIVDERQRLVARLRDWAGPQYSRDSNVPTSRALLREAADQIERGDERERDLINGLALKSQIALQSASARVASLEGLLSEADLVDAGDRALIAVKNGSGRDWVRRVTAALAPPSEGNKKGDEDDALMRERRLRALLDQCANERDRYYDELVAARSALASRDEAKS